MKNKISNLNNLIILQEEAMTIYLNHFQSLLQHLNIKKNNKIKIQKILNELIDEKKFIIEKLNEIKIKKEINE